MNWKHFVALVKLRFQLSINQVKKAGKLNFVISIVLMVCALVFSVSSFFVGAIGGAIWFQEASSETLLITWNVIVAVFLAMWIVGLFVELQQTELMSIDKLLHLPISLRGAFFLNYTSSFVNTTFLMFVPMMFGISVGMVFARGIGMLLTIPLFIACIFLVTSLTYQLRGWLSRLMENKRARGTIVASITIVFIMLTQIPNLINIGFSESRSEKREDRRAELAELRDLGCLEIEVKILVGEVSAAEQGYLLEELDEQLEIRLAEKRQQESEASFRHAMDLVTKVDTYLPPGWLPLGVVRADQGKWLPGVLGTLAMFTIGLVSLTFSYRASMRKYMGVDSRRRRKKKKADSTSRPDEFMFKKLPLASEQVSAVAVSSFRSIVRAPESKMILVLPMILGMVGCALLINNRDFTIPPIVRPWIPVSVIMVTMFGLTSLMFNQFGMDRDGFRALMLSPIKRKDILMGKNLAVAPLAIGICVVLIAVTQIFVPQGFMSLLGSLLQVVSVFLLYCILGNIVSIYFPMGIKRGSMQPANPRFVPMLCMILGSMIGPTLLMIPTSIACGIPMLIEAVTDWKMGWLFLLLSLLQLGLTFLFYFWILKHMDRWFWNRETRILDVVANIPE